MASGETGQKGEDEERCLDTAALIINIKINNQSNLLFGTFK